MFGGGEKVEGDGDEGQRLVLSDAHELEVEYRIQNRARRDDG